MRCLKKYAFKFSRKQKQVLCSAQLYLKNLEARNFFKIPLKIIRTNCKKFVSYSLNVKKF